MLVYDPPCGTGVTSLPPSPIGAHLEGRHFSIFCGHGLPRCRHGGIERKPVDHRPAVALRSEDVDCSLGIWRRQDSCQDTFPGSGQRENDSERAAPGIQGSAPRQAVPVSNVSPIQMCLRGNGRFPDLNRINPTHSFNPANMVC